MATTPAYGSVTVYGVVRASRSLSTELKTDKLAITGNGAQWWAGDSADLYPANAGISHVITLTGARSLEPAGNLSNGATASFSSNKAILTTTGGDLCLMAAIPAVTIVKLAATANIGATSLTMDTPVTWKSGDQVHLSSTDYFRAWPLSNIGTPSLDGRRDEIVTLTADVTNSVTVPVTALTYRHHGQKMYVVPPAFEDVAGTNLSYTYRAIAGSDVFGSTSGGNYLGSRVLNAAAAGANIVIDNRCTVGHLTRPIRVEGSTGTDWTTHGYGGTTMVMDLASRQRLQGVAFNRVGKAGQLGQYPIHHHMRSYTPFGTGGSGTYLGDVNAAFNFTRGCVVRDSSNRGHTFHGTCGAELSNSVFVNTDTHCIFTEDGSERRNVIDGNLVSRVNLIGYSKPVTKLHDATNSDSTIQTGPSGIWLTNPDNYVRNNIVMGGHIGIWNAFTSRYATCDSVTGTRVGNGTIAFTPYLIENGASVSTPETLTLTATSATNFTRTGSVSGALSAVTVGTAASHNSWTYQITAGATPFSVGDQFIFQCVNRAGCLGQSREVNVTPTALTFLQQFNNECGCQGIRSMQTAGAVCDELGTLQPVFNSYGQIGADHVNKFAQAYDDLIEKFNGWKPSQQWYYNQVVRVNYKQWTISGIGPGNVALGNIDAYSQGIEGIASRITFDGVTMSHRTLDNESFTPAGSLLTSYGGARMTNCVLIAGSMGNLVTDVASAAIVTAGGVSKLGDFYNYAVQMVDRNSLNTAIIGAQVGVPGFFNIPHWMLLPEFGVSTTIYDYSLQTIFRSKGNASYRRLPSDGSMFGMAGSWVFNHPFLTYGTTGGVTATGFGNWSTLNGVILPTTYEYYSLRVAGVTVSGLSNATSDNNVYTVWPINYTHLQSDTVTPVTGGTWNTPQGVGNPGGSDVNYPNMRHAAARQGEAYDTFWSRIDMPNRPQGLILELIGMWSTDSNFLWSVDWDGATSVSTISYGTRSFTARTSKANILANRNSNGYWVDTTNNKLWINVYGNDGYTYPTDGSVGATNVAYFNGPYQLKVNR